MYDHSGNQNHGTIIGASLEEISEGCLDPLALNYDELAELHDGSCEYPDNGNYSLNFDGNDDYVDIPSIDFGEDFSFCGFIKFESVDANECFINGDGSSFIRLDGSGDEGD